MWNPKLAQMNLSAKQKQSHGHGEQTCGCQRGGGGSRLHTEFGIIRCNLLHLEWIRIEVLLYSTGDSKQSLVIEHDRR